jgi:hypothetical protein
MMATDSAMVHPGIRPLVPRPSGCLPLPPQWRATGRASTASHKEKT